MIVTENVPDRRFRLILQYDGERFRGWQVQPGERTVQGEVEAALSRLSTRTVKVTAAGRTDTGVHATGQVASAILPGRWNATTLERALNAVLPRDIWVPSVVEVPPEFHARYDAVARGYMYRVGTQPWAHSPFQRRWCWPVRHALDRDRLDEAAARIGGTHSFRLFARSGQPERGDRCTVLRSEWTDGHDDVLEYRVTANRFLHHMVRYLVGTMIDIGRQRRPIADLDALLEGEPGFETSPPAPAAGLYLIRVYYEDVEQSTDPEPPFTAGIREHAGPCDA